MPEIELKPTEYRVRGVTRPPKVRFTFFEARDVVRHPLVAKIVRAYEAQAKAATNADGPEAGE